MDATKRGYADFSWNPIIGDDDPDCFGRKFLAKHSNGCPDCEAFRPHVHSERFREPMRLRNPSVIYVNSLSDWWSPSSQRWGREDAIATIRHNTNQRFIAITKYPELIAIDELTYFPRNMYLGINIAGGVDYWKWEFISESEIGGFLYLTSIPDDRLWEQILDDKQNGLRLPKWIVVKVKGVPVDLGWQETAKVFCANAGIPFFVDGSFPGMLNQTGIPAVLADSLRKGRGR